MTEQQIETPENPASEPKTFGEGYVKELRQEAADSRVKAKENEEQMTAFRDAYREAVLKDECRELLVEPLAWSDDFTGEDGMPDRAKIKEAAEALALEKPHLARIATPIPLGPQGEDTAPVDLAGILRAGV